MPPKGIFRFSKKDPDDKIGEVCLRIFEINPPNVAGLKHIGITKSPRLAEKRPAMCPLLYTVFADLKWGKGEYWTEISRPDPGRNCKTAYRSDRNSLFPLAAKTKKAIPKDGFNYCKLLGVDDKPDQKKSNFCLVSHRIGKGTKTPFLPTLQFPAALMVTSLFAKTPSIFLNTFPISTCSLTGK